jgi:predicted metal-binding membrane protein
MAAPLDGETARSPGDILRALTVPMAFAVGAVVVVAWYVTWATSDLTMMSLGVPTSADGALGLSVAFLLLVVMMVAMMLPSALPMVITYNGLTRLDHGQVSRPADRTATALFGSAYFVVWGAFGIIALLGLLALGLLGPFSGFQLLIPASVLLAAGAYQVTRTKDACLRACLSPAGFMMTHWRSGRRGALRMGLDHAAYCIGCCWLFMLVLFVSGAMSLVWMAGISVAIFVEKVGWRQLLVSRAIGAILIIVGGLVLVQALLAL